MSEEASTPVTEPAGMRAAMAAVVFPLPQPTSRMRSVPLNVSSESTSSAMVACRAERRSYSEAFHSVTVPTSHGYAVSHLSHAVQWSAAFYPDSLSITNDWTNSRQSGHGAAFATIRRVLQVGVSPHGSVPKPSDVGFCPEREAAGGHCPRDRRVHHAEEIRRAELSRSVPFSWRKDAIVFRTRDAAVLSLLRLRRVGGCLQVRAGDRQGQLSGSGEGRRAEVRDRATEAGVLLTGGGSGEPAAGAAAGVTRAGNCLL